jgi:ABC-type amino acid transport substrate-binding protein
MRRAVLLTLLALLLVGCSDLQDLLPEDEGTPEPLDIYVPPTAMPFPPQTSTAARVRERGELIVGVRYDLIPFSFVAEDGMLAGLEVELAHELARRWLGDPSAVRFEQVRSDTALQFLEEGRVDLVLAGLVHTQEAEDGFDFSPPYYADGQALLTFADAGIAGPDDLGGRRVGVLSWGEGEEALRATTSVTPTIVAYDDYEALVEGLRTRQVEAYAGTRHRLERAKREVEGTVIVAQYTHVPVAMAYREDDPFFADLVAFTLREMALDGTRDALYARWLPGTSPPSGAAWPGEPPALALAGAPPERSDRDVVGGIAARGSLRVAYFPDRWPYSGDRDDGVPTGFEVRLLERMVERWLGSQQAVEFVPVASEAEALGLLAGGEVEMLVGSWVRTYPAQAQVAFSYPLFDDGVGILSTAAAPVGSVEALAGATVGVVVGSAGEAAVPALSQAAGVGISAVSYPDRDAAVAALAAGEVAAVVAERGLVLGPLFRQQGLVLTDARYTYRPVAYVLPEGDSEFVDLVNLTLARLHADGTFVELYTLWFDDAVPPAPPWPGQPLTPLVIPTPTP